MAIATGGSRQGENPDNSQPPDQTQSTQTALTKQERLRLYNQAYYQQHKAEKRELNRRYQHLHCTERNGKRRQRYRKNPEPFLSATRQWEVTHREKRQTSQQAWYQKNRRMVLAKNKAYYQQHREQLNAKQRAAYKRQKADGLRNLLGGLAA
jgi:hypothetical protein